MIKQDILENLANTVYLSIGSNLGNKIKNIEKTKYFLEKNLIKIIKTSNIYETFSWPNREHPKFYNVVIKVVTKLKPLDLFFTIKKIEKTLGRKKAKKYNPRTCDIDILDYNGLNLKLEANNNKLLIPHPRLHNRNFVLFPLFEIEKNWKHPKNNISIDKLLKKLDLKSLRTIKIY